MATKPWVEKYRPKQLEDVAHQKSAVSLLKAALRAHSLPHLLFYGPPGTGKTTVALIVARRLFGNAFGDRVLELNASDDRGIDVVRHKIKRRAALGVEETESMPSFRLIILDEADCMTTDAQKALLRTIEVYSAHTRFIILCNYVSRMIGPLVSRCARIRFQSLPEAAMRERICSICDTESVQLDEEGLKVLTRAADGDLRRGIMLLQSAVMFGGQQITSETLLEVSGHVPDSVIDAFEAKSARGPQHAFSTVTESISQGYSAQQILVQFAEKLLLSTDYSELQKAELFQVVAAVDAKLSEGSSEALQLTMLGSAIHKSWDAMITD